MIIDNVYLFYETFAKGGVLQRSRKKGGKMGRIVLLSGPSCIGKGPLYHALKRFCPDLAGKLKQMVLYLPLQSCTDEKSARVRPAKTGLSTVADGVLWHKRSRKRLQKIK